MQVLRKTFLRDARARRTAEIEHDFNKDKDAWSPAAKGVKRTGVFCVSLGGRCGTQGGAHRQKPRDRTGYSEPDAQLHWPRDVTRCHQPKQSSWSWDESDTQHDWSWDKTKSRQEPRSWDTVKTESIKGSVKSGPARRRRDSGTESEGDDPRASKHSPRQVGAEAMVQPTTLPEGWTVFLNASPQVLYGHVKTGMLCFQMPENPEVLNNLVFKGVPANDDIVDRASAKIAVNWSRTSQKSKRHDHHQRSSQYMENSTNHSLMCWIDSFSCANDQRRPTKIAPAVEPISQDVNELKQVAVWHGDRRCINQANEAAAEGVMTENRSTLSHNQEHAITSLILPTLPCVSSPSHSAHIEACENSDAIRANDSVLCGGHCSPRFEGASGTNQTVSREKGDFPLASFPVVDISGGHSFYCPTLSVDSGRDTREEVAGSTGDTGASPRGQSGIQTNGRQERPPQQEPLLPSPPSPPTVERELEPSKRRQREVGPCELRTALTQSNRVHFGRMLTWSGLRVCHAEPASGRHSNKSGTANGAPSVDATMPWMWKDDATTTNDKRDGDVFRMQSVPSVQKGGARTTHNGITCFTVCALVFCGATCREPGNANGRRISQFGGELQHVERSNRVTTRAGVPAGTTAGV